MSKLACPLRSVSIYHPPPPFFLPLGTFRFFLTYNYTLPPSTLDAPKFLIFYPKHPSCLMLSPYVLCFPGCYHFHISVYAVFLYIYNTITPSCIHFTLALACSGSFRVMFIHLVFCVYRNTFQVVNRR